MALERIEARHGERPPLPRPPVPGPVRTTRRFDIACFVAVVVVSAVAVWIRFGGGDR